MANKKSTQKETNASEVTAPLNWKEQGSTGLAVFAGQIQDDFLRELRGQEAYKRYDEMRRNSPIVGALLLAIRQAIRGVSWEFQSDHGDDDPRIDFLKEAMDSMSHSWNDHIVEALTMLPFGHSLFEIVYKREGGKIFWKKFAARGQDTVWQWNFDDAGGIEGFTQQAPPSYRHIFLPIEKLILYRTEYNRNNPEGMSILRTAWIPYYYAKHIQQVEAIGIERDLAGLPKIDLPEGADVSSGTSSDLGVAKKMVRNVRNDEQSGVVLPHGWTFELLSTGGQRQFDTNEIVNRYESRILMCALAQFLLLGQEGVGALALSKDQTDFFTMSVNAIADIVASTITAHPIPRLLKLNGFDPDGITLDHTPAGDIDLEFLADFLMKTGAKITWSPDDELWLRQTAGLPERDIDLITADREAENQRKADIAKNFANQGNNNMTAEIAKMLFGSDPPDLDKRDQHETEWAETMGKYLDGLRKRLKAEARKLRQ